MSSRIARPRSPPPSLGELRSRAANRKSCRARAPGVQVASITVTSPSFADGRADPGRPHVRRQGRHPRARPQLAAGGHEVAHPRRRGSGRAERHVHAHDSVQRLAGRRKLPAAIRRGRTAPARPRASASTTSRSRATRVRARRRARLHRYRFRVVALDTVVRLAEGAPTAQIDEAMDGHIIGEGSLTGHFGH